MTRLRVAFDATPIPTQRVGAGVYVTELLRALREDDVDLHVFVNARDASELGANLSDATLHPVDVRTRPLRLAWSHLVLPRLVRRLRPDVFHGPHYTVPTGLSCPSVVTFHDPTFFTLPHLHERAKVTYFTRAARTGIARASRVIAVSDFARRGAIEHAGARETEVDLVYEGVDGDRYTPAEGRAPDDPYILFVGALEPRKDVPTLIAAYDALASSVRPHSLVLCGLPAWGSAVIDAAIAGARSGRITKTGYVTEDRKIELYRGASLFVYPSIAEGFGLPVLEAMSCGTPTIATTGSAPEEIAGEACVLVPPQNVEALRDAMARVLDDDALARELRTKGRERATRFTWTRAAHETADVWRRAAASGT